jgi:hypothetical protein
MIAPEAWNGIDGVDLLLGFMYLKYQRDGSDLSVLLLKAGDLSDRANFRVECGEFYDLANEVAAGARGDPAARSLPDRVAVLFGPFSDLAERSWVRLQGEGRAAVG